MATRHDPATIDCVNHKGQASVAFGRWIIPEHRYNTPWAAFCVRCIEFHDDHPNFHVVYHHPTAVES